jgi:hypothetical protein
MSHPTTPESERYIFNGKTFKAVKSIPLISAVVLAHFKYQVKLFFKRFIMRVVYARCGFTASVKKASQLCN